MSLSTHHPEKSVKVNLDIYKIDIQKETKVFLKFIL